MGCGEHVFQCLHLQHVPCKRIRHLRHGHGQCGCRCTHDTYYGSGLRQGRTQKSLHECGLHALGSLYNCVRIHQECHADNSDGLCHDILRIHCQRCGIQRMADRPWRQHEQRSDRGHELHDAASVRPCCVRWIHEL